VGSKGGGGGKEEEMTQILYAHINKRKKIVCKKYKINDPLDYFTFQLITFR
jgi:hypothetical protein